MLAVADVEVDRERDRLDRALQVRLADGRVVHEDRRARAELLRHALLVVALRGERTAGRAVRNAAMHAEELRGFGDFPIYCQCLFFQSKM